MKIKFDTDDNWPLNKQLKLNMLTIIVRSLIIGKIDRHIECNSVK